MNTLNKKFLKKNKSAFTLVELIIVITILSILATISFISFQGYTKNARDSNRTATISNLQEWLDLYWIQTTKYPEPEWKVLSWSLNWVQLTKVWTIWETITRLIKSSNVPQDPNWWSYAYWISADNKYYQIWTTLENTTTYNNLTKNIYANNWNYRAKVVWNYIYPLKLNWKFYSLPSLLFTWIWWELSNENNAKFIIDKWENIPYQWNWEINNTQTTTELLEIITWSWWLSLTWVEIPVITSNEFKDENYSIWELSKLWLSKEQVWQVIYWNEYMWNTNVSPNTWWSSWWDSWWWSSSPTYNNCEWWSQSWYTYTWINHNQTKPLTKEETIPNWTRNYWAEATCNDWVITITNEQTNISCTSWYVEQWWNCVQDICWQNIPTNWQSNATSQTVSQNWTYNTTPWVCTFTCNANYTYDTWTNTCVANTKTTSCTWLPTNAVWNTVSSITQTWDWTNWLPLENWTYNTATSTANCNYKCGTNYHTEDSWVSCISNTKSCSITNWTWQQTWNWNSWWSCSVVSCNSWYYSNWNSCELSSCTFNWNTITNWNTVTAYQTSIVAYWSSCVSQTRTCTNWSLSWSYTYSSCSVQAPTWTQLDSNCTIPDITVWSQIWAWCNSTLWSWFEWWKQNNWADGIISTCYSYNETNTPANCPIATTSNSMYSNKKERSWSAASMISWTVDNIWWKLYTWSWTSWLSANCKWWDFSSTSTNSNCPCPTWRHVPTDNEWTILSTTLNWWNICETSTWWQCSWLGWSWNDWRTINNNIIQALKIPLAGRRDIDGISFYYRGYNASLWSSSISGTSVYHRNFLRSYDTVRRVTNTDTNGFSVRCIKD